MVVTFLTSGGPETGMGHIYETLQLADAVSDETAVQFSLYRSELGAEMIEDRRYETTVTTELSDITAHLSSPPDGTVVVDLPKVKPALLDGLATQTERRLVLFGNPGINVPVSSEEWVDVLVNYTAGIGDNRSEHVEKDGTTILRGPQYFPLRPEFRTVDCPAPTLPPQRVFLMFGGSDPRGLTKRALESLDIEWDRITAVVGPGNSDVEDIRRLATDRETITLFREIDDVAAKMAGHDLVLTSPGASTFEALSLGRPTLAFSQNEFQKRAYADVSFAYGRESLDHLPRLIAGISGERYGAYRETVGSEFDYVVSTIVGGNR